jgi:hypothetical protein
MKAYKFKVDNPEQSERLQCVLIKTLGYHWYSGSDAQYLNAAYIFADSDGELVHNPAGGGFEEYTEYETKDTEKFIRRHSEGQAERGIAKHSQAAVKKAKKSKWHSVADGMPDSHLVDFLIVCKDDSSVMMAYVADGKWQHSRDHEIVEGVVTHWRKLPNSPKE